MCLSDLHTNTTDPALETELKKNALVLAALLALSVSMSSVSRAADEYRIELQGLSEELEDNVRAHITDLDERNPAAAARALRRATVEGLKAMGYYTPEIEIKYHRTDKPAGELIAQIDAGEQVKLLSPDISLVGQAQTDPDFALLIGNVPQYGAPLNHGTYSEFKDKLLSLSLEKGYFDGRFTDKRLAVSPHIRSAQWHLHYDSGKRYRWGKITYKGSQIDSEYLKGLEKFSEGDFYDYNQYAQLSKRLGDTGWFASIAAEPDFAAGKRDPERHLPVEVTVTPRKQNLFETGLGFSSDIGLTAKLKWTRPWINAKGHSIYVSTEVSSKERLLDASYRIPSKEDPIGNYWLVQGGYKYKDLNDTESDQIAGSISRNIELKSGWVRSISLNVVSDDYTQAEIQNKSTVIYPGISYSRTRAKGGLNPNWGDTQRYALYVANGMWGSDSDFVRAEINQTWLRTLAVKHRFIFRGSLGWIETDDIVNVPPDLRFFAGGDNSVRGYNHESISPTNEKGELTGGSKMITLSAEYQYNAYGNWWGAVFVDAGDAVRSLDDLKLNKGAGAGIRWNSPIGLIKVDVAWPIGSDIDSGMHFYFGLGSAL